MKIFRQCVAIKNQGIAVSAYKIFRAGLCVAAGSLPLVGCGGSDSETPPPIPPVATSAYERANDKVVINNGILLASAESTSAMRIFKAIPFAAPPIGPLRWKAPEPVASWSGVRRADTFSPGCMIGNRPFSNPNSILYQSTEQQSEDCLYLNVWTSAAAGATNEKRPVMLLLHGGGLLIGSGSQPNYNGTGLASKGAVVVTLNYRLGPLGFLAHPQLSAESANGTSGNYGLLDAIAALKWVQANVAQFGGDPANVTLYSESAGAQLSSVLLVSPLAKGLFHRAVLGSLAGFPAGTNTPTLSQAETVGTRFATNLGSTSIASLREKLPQDIMAGVGALNSVIVDGYAMPDQLDKLYTAGQINDVPLMTGWNSDEATPYPAFATTISGYNSAVQQRYGVHADAFRKIYPATTDAEVVEMAYAPMRDSLFAWQPWTLARAHSAHARSKTYLYFFNRRPGYFPDQHFIEQDPPEKYGAYHTLEQVYFYNNLERSAPVHAYTDLDRQIADAASSYLINFAKTGNPNGTALATWPVFTGPDAQTMMIGDRIQPGPVPFRPALDFFDRFYTETLGRPLPFGTK